LTSKMGHNGRGNLPLIATHPRPDAANPSDRDTAGNTWNCKRKSPGGVRQRRVSSPGTTRHCLGEKDSSTPALRGSCPRHGSSPTPQLDIPTSVPRCAGIGISPPPPIHTHTTLTPTDPKQRTCVPGPRPIETVGSTAETAAPGVTSRAPTTRPHSRRRGYRWLATEPPCSHSRPTAHTGGRALSLRDTAPCSTELITSGVLPSANRFTPPANSALTVASSRRREKPR
jgi:hypothetical protein